MNHHAANSDATTWVVPLTPEGRGAIATVLVAGPDALRHVLACLPANEGRRVAASDTGRTHLCHFGGAGGLPAEEVVLFNRRAGRIEIHCHGGVAASRAIVDRLERLGCRPIDWTQWLSAGASAAAELGTGPLDRIQCDAARWICRATTRRTAAVLLDQLGGAMSRECAGIIEDLSAGRGAEASDRLKRLDGFAEVGLHLIDPWRVVLVGRPNVGKSSLINALSGYQRSLVCANPGTTRDLLTSTAAMGGWPVEFCDTAGIRETGDPLEASGMEAALHGARRADLVILVDEVGEASPECSATADSTGHIPKPYPWQHDRHFWDRLLQSTDCSKRLRVVNKCDRASPRGNPAGALPTSAVTGEGLDVLTQSIVRRLVPEEPLPGAAVPFLPEHVRVLRSARDLAEAGRLSEAAGVLAGILGVESR